MRGKNRVNERETCFIQLRGFNFYKKIPSYHNCLSVLSVPAAFCTAFLHFCSTTQLQLQSGCSSLRVRSHAIMSFRDDKKEINGRAKKGRP